MTEYIRDDNTGEPLFIPDDLTPEGEQYFRSLFEWADEDGDGFITLKELRRFILRSHRKIKERVPRRIIQMMDKDHDGKLNFEEFVHMIEYPRWSDYFSDYINRYVHFILPKRKLIDDIDGIYEEHYHIWPPRIGMILISLIELIFFIIDEENEMNSTKFAKGPMAKLFIYEPTKRYEIWRYFTYMFVHIGYTHLVVNLIVQLMVGCTLELVHGWWRVLLIYFAGVLAGSLGTSICDPFVKLAGASGGVYSLFTAHIAAVIMNWGDMTFPAIHLFLFLLITGTDTGYSIYNRYFNNSIENIGYVAHFGGALAGLLVGIQVLRNFHITNIEKYIKYITLTIYIILMVIAIIWNLFWTDYFPPQGDSPSCISGCS